MADSRTFVIVGGGLGGAKAAEALREKGFDGKVVLIAAEEHLPYERPPLSKDFLAGKKSLGDFTVHDSDWYRQNKIELRTSTEALSIDPTEHTVTLSDDTSLHYDKLLLATGARSRWLEIPGAESTGVHYLRTFDDASNLDTTLKEGTSLAVIGAGWIGLEVAASARQRGVDVTVVETAEGTPEQRGRRGSRQGFRPATSRSRRGSSPGNRGQRGHHRGRQSHRPEVGRRVDDHRRPRF